MEEFVSVFRKYLEEENKSQSVIYSLSLVKEGKISIVDFYEKVLVKTMNSIECHNDEKNLCIWKEHVRSGICRTIIESMYPFVLEERNRSYSKQPMKKAAVVCPDGEYHDMGARIVTDYFTLLNWDAVFVGNSTPKEEFVKVANHLELDALAISITTPYNLVAAKGTIDLLRRERGKELKIFIGGSGLSKVAYWEKDFHADAYVSNFQDLKQALEGGEQDVSV